MDNKNKVLTPLEIILNILSGGKTPRPGVLNPVSSTTMEQMKMMGSYFPGAHTDARKMYELARANYEILGYDGIMPVFSIVIEAASNGCRIDWGKIDMMPRVIGKLWKDYRDIDIQDDFLERKPARAVIRTISMLKDKYPEIAVIGKVFGPWTLAYEFFGVEDFLIKTITGPDEVNDILNKLKSITIKFARAQIDAGADIITVADHATRDLCSPDSYRDFLIPVHSMLAEEINAPIILHICGDTSDRIDHIARTGMEGFHFESKVDACMAVKAARDRIVLVGNVNNPSTLLFGKREDIRKEVEYAIKCGVRIIGPECAVPLNTPLDNLKEIERAVKSHE